MNILIFQNYSTLLYNFISFFGVSIQQHVIWNNKNAYYIASLVLLVVVVWWLLRNWKLLTPRQAPFLSTVVYTVTMGNCVRTT